MIITKADFSAYGWKSSAKIDEIEVKNVTTDSRDVKKNTAFFAYDGVNFKGKDFIWSALKNNAAAVFLDSAYEAEVYANPQFAPSLPIFFSQNFHEAAGQTISLFMGEPSRHLECIGVTGTNGKTTITLAFYRLFLLLNKRAGYIGTLGTYLRLEKMPTSLTTPALIDNQRILQKAYKKRIIYMAIEASSHGLNQGRLSGVDWNLGIFTNLSPEHLDYHESMQNYYESKKILFEQLVATDKRVPGIVVGAVIHVNNPWGIKLHQWLIDQKPSFPILSLGDGGNATITEIIRSWQGYRSSLLFAQKKYELKTRMLGDFNLYNMASVFLGSLLMGLDPDETLEAIGQQEPPPGRMEVLTAAGNRHIVIDYSHTPDALENALRTLQELAPVRVICVFGCGGDRDKEKRPLMGAVSSKNADFTILTNDNPRNEDPQHIINQIKEGIDTRNYVVVYERDRAIRAGLQITGVQEVLLIAGKGHEDYQIIKDKKIRFSDRNTVQKLLNEIEFSS